MQSKSAVFAWKLRYERASIATEQIFYESSYNGNICSVLLLLAGSQLAMCS
jgi:hypothetical protein